MLALYIVLYVGAVALAAVGGAATVAAIGLALIAAGLVVLAHVRAVG